VSRVLQIASIAVLLCYPTLGHAQEDEVSLGDLARSVRKSKPPQERKAEEQKVIDNDNFAVMMDRAESERLNGKPIFSIDPSGKAFTMTSPDGTCSISFDAKATALISTPYIASDLPQDELLKLDGPAAIHDDVIEVSLHNGTGWELKEIVVGIIVLQNQSGAELHPAKLVPEDPTPAERLPDLTVLYHLKATAAPDSTTVFRGTLGGDLSQAGALSQTKDWHWALVAARGIPPSPSVPGAPLAQQVTMPPAPMNGPQPLTVQPSATQANDNAVSAMAPNPQR
jgi:hypothetical protein